MAINPYPRNYFGLPQPENLFKKAFNFLATTPLQDLTFTPPKPQQVPTDTSFRGPLPPRPAGTYDKQRAEFVRREGVPALVTDFGKTLGSGYMTDGQVRREFDSGSALGGFARPSTADANLAFEDEQNRLFSERVAQERGALQQRDRDLQQAGLNARTDNALQVLSGSWANPAMKAQALQTLQAAGVMSGQNLEREKQSLEGYKASNMGALQQAQGQQALATAEASRAAIPYVGPMAEADMAQKRSEAAYRGALAEGYPMTLNNEFIKAKAAAAKQGPEVQKMADAYLKSYMENHQTNPALANIAAGELERLGVARLPRAGA